MARATLQYGSTGEDVKYLQDTLKSLGFYDASIDGKFGDKTLAAVKNFQKYLGLGQDGIVGKNTWAGLDKQTTKTPEYTDYTMKEAPTYTNYTPDQFDPEGKYGSFTWEDQAKYDQYISNYENRTDFSYDLNGDALYQQYKDKYIKQGKMAMADTMGQAAAMTGGYGSSYASTAGNQAYQASLENLNDVVPELYNMAYNRYNQEGQDMLNMISLLGNERNFEYGKWSDDYNREYQKWSDQTNIGLTNHTNDYNHKMSVWQTENDIGLTNHNNAWTNAWQKAEFEEGQRQFNAQQALNEEQLELQKKNSVTDNGYVDNLGQEDDGEDDAPTQEEYAQPTPTINTNNFISNHKSVAEFTRSGQKTQAEIEAHLNGIKADINAMLENGSMTEAEALYLINYYGLK